MVFVCVALLTPSLQAMERVVFTIDGVRHDITGRILVEASDGGLMVEETNGYLWLIQANEIQSRESDGQEFTPLTQEEMAEALLTKMPRGFRIHKTAHYVVCYNTSQNYAEWVTALYERLYTGFYTYWKNQDVELKEPEVPFVVLIFADQNAYARHVKAELGVEPGTMIAYFHMLSNAVTMFDLTGTQSGVQPRNLRSSDEINRVLSRPQAAAMVATIVHEATHQLACNSGLQPRLADVPFWVSEGLAVYFEVPDLRSNRGWRGIGNINRVRLVAMKQYMRNRPHDSLATLLGSDRRFRDPNGTLDAYAEAWALNYFLFKQHKKEYLEYVRSLQEKQPLRELTEQERIQEFETHFGNLDDLDREFLRFIARLN